MHIAILNTNTDDSAFGKAHPDDGEKFRDLIHEVRPDWQCDAFLVCKGAFPDDISRFDGVIITGSPASVLDDASWIARLEALIREIIAARIPLFGACFGHQVIAKVLGAGIISNPQGWGHGRLALRRVGQTPWSGPDAALWLYGSHSEQVDRLPDGATLVFEGEGVPIAGFALGDRVFTVQHHPEMTHGFITALVAELADKLGPEVTRTARASLQGQADRPAFALELAHFFEHAVNEASGAAWAQ